MNDVLSITDVSLYCRSGNGLLLYLHVSRRGRDACAKARPAPASGSEEQVRVGER